MTVNLDSPIWDEAAREQIVSRGLTRIAKKFKQKTVTAMIEGVHTGAYYRPRLGGPGLGFTRLHHASARSERPSPDTLNLVNSVEDEKIAPLQHAVFVNDAQAPYGKYLQFGMDRPIMTGADVVEFEATDGAYERDRIKRELVN